MICANVSDVFKRTIGEFMDEALNDVDGWTELEYLNALIAVNTRLKPLSNCQLTLINNMKMYLQSADNQICWGFSLRMPSAIRLVQ